MSGERYTASRTRHRATPDETEVRVALLIRYYVQRQRPLWQLYYPPKPTACRASGRDRDHEKVQQQIGPPFREGSK